MLTRRHIRVKVMQSLYAMRQAQTDNLEREKKFLSYSMEQMYDLFLINLQLLLEIREFAEELQAKRQKKHLATTEEKNPNSKFITNGLLQILADNKELQTTITARKLNIWKLDSEYVVILWKEISESELYASYMSATTTSFKTDKEFVVAIFKELIAPNDKIFEYYEDQKLTWVDDLPLVNTAIVKMLKKIKPTHGAATPLPKLYKDIDDKAYAVNLFTKTALNATAFGTEIEGKTPNWDNDRIAELDKTIIKLGICEFLKFPSIPVKVTINEYLEIAKEYSTPKSSIFINGILDKLSKEYLDKDKLNKIGRGLM